MLRTGSHKCCSAKHIPQNQWRGYHCSALLWGIQCHQPHRHCHSVPTLLEQGGFRLCIQTHPFSQCHKLWKCKQRFGFIWLFMQKSQIGIVISLLLFHPSLTVKVDTPDVAVIGVLSHATVQVRTSPTTSVKKVILTVSVPVSVHLKVLQKAHNSHFPCHHRIIDSQFLFRLLTSGKLQWSMPMRKKSHNSSPVTYKSHARMFVFSTEIFQRKLSCHKKIITGR